MNTVTDSNDHPLYRLLRRHFITIGGLTRRRSDPEDEASWHPFDISGFVISVQGEWFFVTAGHVLDDVEAASAEQVFAGWYVDDAGAYGGKHHNSIPFDFEGSPKFSLVDLPEGYDYGFIYLRPYYVGLLSSNAILAADENHRNNMPDEFDWYAIVGTPQSSLRLKRSGDDFGVIKEPVYIQLNRITDPPEDIVKPRPMFYGGTSIGRRSPDRRHEGDERRPDIWIQASRGQRAAILADSSPEFLASITSDHNRMLC